MKQQSDWCSSVIGAVLFPVVDVEVCIVVVLMSIKMFLLFYVVTIPRKLVVVIP